MSKLTSMSGNSVHAPADTYFIGDLCYVIRDDDLWSKICDAMFPETSNEANDGLLEVLGHQFVSFSTKYGDGTYYGSGNAFSVDSGMIGMISLNTLAALGQHHTAAYLAEHGCVRTYQSDFSCENDDGVLYFGNLVIDTACVEDEEEDDHWGDYDDEEEDF